MDLGGAIAQQRMKVRPQMGMPGPPRQGPPIFNNRSMPMPQPGGFTAPKPMGGAPPPNLNPTAQMAMQRLGPSMGGPVMGGPPMGAPMGPPPQMQPPPQMGRMMPGGMMDRMPQRRPGLENF